MLFSIGVFSGVFPEDTLFETMELKGRRDEKKKKDQVKNAGWICMHQREAVHFVMAEAAILNSRETGTSRTGIRTGGCREVIFKLGVKGAWNADWV